MQTNSMAYLSEMGIDTYQLMHPQLLSGCQVAAINLPADCKMLLVSPTLPEGSQAEFLERVLKSMQLTLAQIRHVFPQQVEQVQPQSVEWLWFAGCPSSDALQGKVLSSPLLSDIDGNNQQRKALWQQICTYSE